MSTDPSTSTLNYVFVALGSLVYLVTQVLYYASRLLVGFWRILSSIIIRPITTVIYILALPFLYFIGWVSAIVNYIGDLFQGFETLWMFLATAALLGTIAGLVMFGVSTGMIKLLGWETLPSDFRSNEKVRSVQQYREDRERKRERKVKSELSMIDVGSSTGSSGAAVERGRTAGQSSKWTGRGLHSPTTILEEVDSEE